MRSKWFFLRILIILTVGVSLVVLLLRFVTHPDFQLRLFPEETMRGYQATDDVHSLVAGIRSGYVARGTSLDILRWMLSQRSPASDPSPEFALPNDDIAFLRNEFAKDMAAKDFDVFCEAQVEGHLNPYLVDIVRDVNHPLDRRSQAFILILSQGELKGDPLQQMQSLWAEHGKAAESPHSKYGEYPLLWEYSAILIKSYHMRWVLPILFPKTETDEKSVKSLGVSSPYSSDKIDAALEWYRAFKNANGHQIDEGDIEQALVYAKVLSSVDGKREDALAIYDSLLNSKLQVHEKRQIQAETGSLLIRLATHSKGVVREQYLSRARKITEDLLWVQDLWFGQGVSILAHVYMLEGNYEKAIKLTDEFRKQFNPSDNELVKLSLTAELRYVTAVAMHEKVKRLIALNGDKSEIIRLLIGDQKDTKSGALQHFLNVSIRYSNTEWAEDASARANSIVSLLDKQYGLKVKVPSQVVSP